MIAAHFEAVKSIVEALGMNVSKIHDTDAGTEPVPPYLVLWGGDFERYAVDVADCRDEVAGHIGITCVALAAGAARAMQSKLADHLDGQIVDVPGRRGFELVEAEVQPIRVDRELQIPTSSGEARFPYYGVLTYRVESTEGST